VSESAPERSGGGGGNVFTRKVGPLPMWAWMAILAGVAMAYYLYHSSKTKAASSAVAGTTAAQASNAAGGVDSSLVPQFVNQTYVENTPPAAPTATSTPTTAATGPAYGLAGPPNANYQAITPAEAGILESNSNTYNTAGAKAQRPFIWNGSAYVPNTNPINSTTQYYAGPLETQEINTAVQKGTVSSTGAPKS
jgi:hypothetical protein